MPAILVLGMLKQENGKFKANLLWTGKMARGGGGVNVPAAKPDDLHLIPGFHMVEGRNRFP